MEAEVISYRFDLHKIRKNWKIRYLTLIIFLFNQVCFHIFRNHKRHAPTFWTTLKNRPVKKSKYEINENGSCYGSFFLFSDPVLGPPFDLQTSMTSRGQNIKSCEVSHYRFLVFQFYSETFDREPKDLGPPNRHVLVKTKTNIAK